MEIDREILSAHDDSPSDNIIPNNYYTYDDYTYEEIDYSDDNDI